MLKKYGSFFVLVALAILWAAPGSAFQLFGSDASSPTNTISSLNSTPQTGTQTPLELGEGGDVDMGNGDSMNIWIPGLGVVGKMPKLDFGLDLLYGAQNPREDAPRTAQELEEFESDFAIKGTIKRKF